MVNNNTVSVQCQVLNSAGTPVNITGFTIKWQLFSNDTPPVALIAKSTGAASITITDGLNGIFNISILAADTVNIPQGHYAHEAVTTDLGGNPVTIVNNDPVVSAGSAFIRQQKTPQ